MSRVEFSGISYILEPDNIVEDDTVGSGGRFPLYSSSAVASNLVIHLSNWTRNWDEGKGEQIIGNNNKRQFLLNIMATMFNFCCIMNKSFTKFTK